MSDATCSGGYEASGSGPRSGPVRCTCSFLEDVQYFLEDVFKCPWNPKDVLRYLWAMANMADMAEGSQASLQVNGDFAAGVEEMVKQVAGEDKQPEVVPTDWNSKDRFKLKAFILKGSRDDPEVSHFIGLTRLRFKHGARILLV